MCLDKCPDAQKDVFFKWHYESVFLIHMSARLPGGLG